MNIKNKSNKRFFDKVKEVRNKQRESGRSKSKQALEASKKAERQLDKMIFEIEKLNSL